MDKISVCMATYNGAKYIRQQLLSILCQIDEDDEVIISDDHSTDDTLMIIEELSDPRIHITKNKGKRGPMGNFEQALMLAKGAYIILADQDDIWLPNKVEVNRLLLQKNDLVLSDCYVVNAKGSIMHPSFFSFRGSRPGFLFNLYRNSYIGCCMAFRQSVLKYVLPFPATIHMHDWWIGLLVEVKGSVHFYPEPLIFYVRHGENASPTGEGGHSLFNRINNRFFLVINLLKRLLLS